MRTSILLLVVFAFVALSVQSQNYVSKVWVADKGDGTYKNPILYTDYSDPDVCRVGDDYYMTASSFNCIPGLQILHSKDLVNWKLIGAAIKKQIPFDVFSKPQHGNGVWAPSIRYHNNEFYIFYGDPDYGVYMTKAKKAEGPWEPVVLVKAGKGIIDPCPLWDEDGRVYLTHAYAGSRAGLKSVLAVCELSTDATKAITEDVIVFDGHEKHHTCEGPKFYKRNNYYYIFTPAGGVPTGWQLILRSKSIYGPYEEKIALAQGKTAVNGPHQGGWVDTKTGEDWFIHFQDVGAKGRIVHLQPMVWKNDWPVMGIDKDNDGCGDPVMTYKKPNVGATYPICTPVESDEFDYSWLGLQWQWHGNSSPLWAYYPGHKGYMRMYSVPIPANYTSLWDLPNLLMQKITAPALTATTKFTFSPSEFIDGERAGLVLMGRDYGVISVTKTKSGLLLSQSFCKDADKGKKEVISDSLMISEKTIYMQLAVQNDNVCQFKYSFDGKKFIRFGSSFTAREGKWIGAKMGLFINRPVSNNDGGWIDVDWFRVE